MARGPERQMSAMGKQVCARGEPHLAQQTALDVLTNNGGPVGTNAPVFNDCWLLIFSPCTGGGGRRSPSGRTVFRRPCGLVLSRKGLGSGRSTGHSWIVLVGTVAYDGVAWSLVVG